jgi:hypothetical protein
VNDEQIQPLVDAIEEGTTELRSISAALSSLLGLADEMNDHLMRIRDALEEEEE